MWQFLKQRSFTMNHSTYKVVVTLTDLENVDWIYDAEGYCNEFNRRIAAIKIPGQYYQPSHLYKARAKEQTVEIWKYRFSQEAQKEVMDFIMYTVNKVK